MRNIISHEYGEIDNVLVFNSVNEELTGDVNEFLDCIRKGLM